MNDLEYSRHVVSKFYKRDTGAERFEIRQTQAPNLQCTCNQAKADPGKTSCQDCRIVYLDFPPLTERKGLFSR